MSRLKIKDNDVWIDIPSIVGPQGPQGPIGPQGPTGSNGVYVGSNIPTDPDVNVWVDTDEESASIPTKTSDLTNDSGFTDVYVGSSAPTDNDTQIWLDTSAQGQSTVTSINGKSGTVTLNAEDVGAVPYEWTLLGTSSSSSQIVTYPADAKEILIKGFSDHGSVPGYFCTVPVSMFSDLKIIFVGGYYSSSSDHGLANVNVDPVNRTLAFRNLVYGNSSTGTYTFWYR